MNDNVNAILNRIQTIQSNINKKIQPFQDKMRTYHNKKSLTDDGFAIFNKIDILKRSLALNNQQKEYHYFKTDTGNRQREFINFLKDINRNHIQKDKNGEYIYSFIYELIIEKKDISSNIRTIKNDKKKFTYLQNKYAIQPSEKFDRISKSTLQNNQIIPFLYLLHHKDFKDENKEKAEKSLKSIFSILFYDRKSQQTFYKNIHKIEQSTNDIDFEIYHNFLQYHYFNKN